MERPRPPIYPALGVTSSHNLIRVANVAMINYSLSSFPQCHVGTTVPTDGAGRGGLAWAPGVTGRGCGGSEATGADRAPRPRRGRGPQ